MNKKKIEKYGGMIPLHADNLLKKKIYYKNSLFFSHGRSAMIWLINNKTFDCALMCSYTWPAIPKLMKDLKLKIYFFDMYQKAIEKILKKITGNILLIVPVFYGFQPWINYLKISEKYKNVFVLLDAAQTAFGHKDYKVPLNGAILSCPHKSTSINDGAILKLYKINKDLYNNYIKIKPDYRFSKIKKKTRILLNSMNKKKELLGIKYSKKLEESWKSAPPKKITPTSFNEFSRINYYLHKKKRLQNFYCLKSIIGNRFKIIPNLNLNTPFAYPSLINNRDKVIKKLHSKRIYATPLWPKSIFINKKFKHALKFKKKFLAFPIDQRYSINDIKNMGKQILSIFDSKVL